MQEKILFIIDDLELKYFEFNDLITDFWLIREFLKRGRSVSIAVKSGLFIENAAAAVHSYGAFLKDGDIFYSSEKDKNLINDFDTVFFRPDPPVDINYINACNVFEYADSEKTFLINNPLSVRNFNEKLSINRFPEYAPENIVTSSAELILEFTAEKKEAVLKPLNRCFGSGVYYLNSADKNLLTIIDSITEGGKTQVMVQEYLKEAQQGDKRVLITAGRVMDECIQKLPAEHNFKFAEHADKYFMPASLTQREREAAEHIARSLAAEGIYTAGLDVINEKIIEINVTSPCYFIREINQNYGIHFEDKVMQMLEELIKKQTGRLYAAVK